jgi:hypothetical protein
VAEVVLEDVLITTGRATDPQMTFALIDGMFHLRHDSFHERLGWDVVSQARVRLGADVVRRVFEQVAHPVAESLTLQGSFSRIGSLAYWMDYQGAARVTASDPLPEGRSAGSSSHRPFCGRVGRSAQRRTR